jgi:hypothetical protein
MGAQVISILGARFVLPHYRDHRGPPATFRAMLIDDGSILVSGTGTVFGLVLHRSVESPVTVSQIYRRATWTISEPTTGCRVATGWTRQQALDALAERVAYLGGEDAFRVQLDIAISSANHMGDHTQVPSSGKN